MMREAVANIAQLSLFSVLLDRVEGFLLGYLHLSICPSGHFNNHVQNASVVVGE